MEIESNSRMAEIEGVIELVKLMVVMMLMLLMMMMMMMIMMNCQSSFGL